MFGKLLQQKRFLLKMHKNAFGDRAPLHPDPLAGSGGARRTAKGREGKGQGGEGKESSAIVLTGSSQIRHRYTVVPLATVTMSR